MPDLSVAQVSKVVTLVETGYTYKEVAQTLRVSKSVIFRNVKRYRQTGRYTRREGQGRKRVTTERDDRFIVSSVLRNQTSTYSEARNKLQEVREVAVNTIRTRLKDAGTGASLSARGPLLTIGHRVARSSFDDDPWGKVLFTDEFHSDSVTILYSVLKQFQWNN